MTVPTPRPPLLPALAALPHPRRLTGYYVGDLVYTAVCPHGRDTDWLAYRADGQSHPVCLCTCPEEAA